MPKHTSTIVTRRALLAALSTVFALAACDDSPRPTEPIAASSSLARMSPSTDAGGAQKAMQKVIASGLLYPRGFTFGPDGDIYVAEAGTPQGNTKLTVGMCEQVPAPQGPRRGGATGRISRIDAAGTVTTVASGLPSSADPADNILGVTDVAFVGKRLYALLVSGCSEGNLTVPSSVIRVEPTGTWSVAADLSAWIKANPVANPNLGDFEPDGDWYSMASAGGLLFVVEANQGNLVSVVPASGRVTRVADVSAVEGHAVPTGVAVVGGDLLVGELTAFPAVPGAAKVLRYGRNGRIQDALGGFTAIVGTAADRHGNVYVLESFTCPTAAPCFPSPGSGRVVRVSSDGAREVVATGLSFATSLRLGPDGALYVANFGYGPPAAGEIIRIATDVNPPAHKQP